MALIRTVLSSPTLMRNVSLDLYFPTDLPEIVGNKINGVLTLLHGLKGGHTDWGLFSSAHRYAADNGFVLVMPSADNSFYNDMVYGANYYTFISEELPFMLSEIFNLPTEREKNFIAGLSMGGYGALRVALSNPQRYAACGSFSGSLDMQLILLAAKTPGIGSFVKKVFQPIFGASLKAEPTTDLVHLAKNVSQLPKSQQPRIFLTCGSEDDTEYQIKTQNKLFLTKTKDLALDINYNQWTGVHDWAFWDRSLAEFFGFAQNNNYGERKKQDWANTISTKQKEPQL